MIKIKYIFLHLNIILLSSLLIFTSCGKSDKKISDDKKLDEAALQKVDTGGATNGDWLIIRELSDAERLNPTVSTDASAQEIESYIFESLNNIDEETFELIPWLADLPTESPDHLTYTYHLKKNCKFSDGQPLTADDFLFTMKLIKNPMVDDASLRNYFEMVKKVETDPGDPYTIRVIMLKPYWKALYTNGTFVSVLPKHILDPQGLTDKMSWDDLADFKSASKNPNIQKFADFINSQEVSRDPKYVVGSGPYMLESWKTGQAITVKRNPNYWYAQTNPAYVDKIIFKTIQDNSASVVSAKNKEVDAMFVVSPVDFYKNLENADQFNLLKAKPSEPTYSYLGWNEVNPLFKDKNVRMALSYCVDRKTMIEKILYGDAVPIQSHIYYKNKKFLNADLPVIPFDLEKAKQLLTDAGWKMNEKGVLEKVIDGKKTEFKFTFLINTNPVRKQVLLVVIEALKKVGIQAGLQEIEWSVYIDKTKKHEYDATYGSWTLPVTPDDPYQLWHSSQAQGEGSNYISFINPQSDSLIEAYRNEFDEAKRIDIIKKWQKLIYDEQPYTFLWSSKSRYVYDVRFKNARWFSKQPSPTYNEWWVPKGSQKYNQNSQM